MITGIRGRYTARVPTSQSARARANLLRLLLRWAACCALGAATVAAASPDDNTTGPRPRIAIVIDDLGPSFDSGRRVIELPGPVACAFLPYARHTASLAHLAHTRHKEVMLHLPMQAVERANLDPGGLTLDMTQQQVVQTILEDLNRVPHVSGLNNHMGSLLTRHPGHMSWLMEVLQGRRDLFFVDSRTTRQTVAQRLADEKGVPAVSRDVFLDYQPGEASIQAQFLRLLQLARKNGSALAIGHPYPSTLEVLTRELSTLEAHGVKLVSVSRLVQHQQERKSRWQVSLSP